ncbi:MAG: ImmA/IrrE family metallo-endopeptidase [Planctomycetes bacterium]|nr:ImmA/IrrE family metallo-endopeptidase [Planctomycetota bacterium]
MPITQEELGRRIKVAREACRLTQEEVATRVELPRPSIAQMELGNRNVTSLELDRLARLFGRDLRELLAEPFEERDAFAALFRAQQDALRSPDILDRLRECTRLGREMTSLERILGVDRGASSSASYAVENPGASWEAVRQGEAIALEERQRLGLGHGPLRNLADVLESEGIRTAIVELPPDVSGLTLNDPSYGALVVANDSEHAHRIRFSLAHEYAHVLLDRTQLGIVSRPSERNEMLEVRANAFAAAFLMPAQGVLQFLHGFGKGQPSRMRAEIFNEDDAVAVEGRTAPGTQDIQPYDLALLAAHFGVSPQAMLYRLLNIQAITKPTFAGLNEQVKASVVNDFMKALHLEEEPDLDVREEFRRRYLGLALEAYRRGEITKGKLEELAALVQLSGNEVALLIEQVSGGDEPVDVILPKAER